MTHHKFWKGLNRDPDGDPRTRWDNNYILTKEWYEYFIFFTALPVIAMPLLPLYILMIITSQMPPMIAPHWTIWPIVLFTPIGLWYLFGFWKILPYFLKKYNIITYKPKQH